MSDSPPPATPAPGAAPAPRRRLVRTVCLLVIGTVLAGGAWAYRHYQYERPIGSGPAGPPVPREPFQRVWSERPVLLVGFGDSVTDGFGSSPGRGYFDLLVKSPADEDPQMREICLTAVLPKLRAVNLALSGSTSQEHVELLLPKLEQQNDETVGIVVLTTGGNDIIHNYGRTPPREGAMYGATLEQARPWIANFTSRLDDMLDAIASKFPGGCYFFLANIYDPSDGVGDIQNAGLPPWPDGLQVLDAYNQVLADCAARRPDVYLVDMYGTFLGHGIHCTQFWRAHYCAADPHYWYFDNLEDPNDRGYDALRRVFLMEMANVLPNALRQ